MTTLSIQRASTYLLSFLAGVAWGLILVALYSELQRFVTCVLVIALVLLAPEIQQFLGR